MQDRRQRGTLHGLGTPYDDAPDYCVGQIRSRSGSTDDAPLYWILALSTGTHAENGVDGRKCMMRWRRSSVGSGWPSLHLARDKHFIATLHARYS
jgi:hypothetical protein